MSTRRTPSGSEVLITGGSDGIGLGLAARYLATGSKVVVTGRSRERLERAAHEHPGLLTVVSDIGIPEEREALAAFVRGEHPGLSVLINNAGIQRRVSLASDRAPWAERQQEIDILLAGPLHLNSLLVPTILAHGHPSAIVNVTSGGAYVPQPFAPVYSACKAALHNYTVNLRFALAATACRVIEVIPPAVRTALAGPGATHGVALDEFCDVVFTALTERYVEEIGFGPTTSDAFQAPKKLYQAMFDEFSTRFPVEHYGSR